MISTVKKSRDPLSRAATILRRESESQVGGALIWFHPGKRVIDGGHLLLRKARAVIPDVPSSLLQRNDPSAASHSCSQETLITSIRNAVISSPGQETTRTLNPL